MLKFKIQKGKAYKDLPKKVLEVFPTTKYVVSTKYDGNRVIIWKEWDEVRFFTSDMHEFYIDHIAKQIAKINRNFIMEAEYMHDCLGKNGDRVHSAKLTTYRTNFRKQLPNNTEDEEKTYLKVFDFLPVLSNGSIITNIPYIERLKTLRSFEFISRISPIDYLILEGTEALVYAKSVIEHGYEGAMAVELDSSYHLGKRVNHSVKLKNRDSVDLLCIGVEYSEDTKYDGMIASLVLQDSMERTVSVGSGLSDTDRVQNSDYFIGKIIEIEYDIILHTYIQPVYKRRRLDKHESD